MLNKELFYIRKVDGLMELIRTKNMKEQVFCNICEKDRKHVLATYEGINENNEPYTLEFQRCKSCGNEKELM